MLPRCIFGPPATARLCHGAFPSVYPWQFFRLMHLRGGFGRENRQFAARFARHASENGLALARYARHASEKPRKQPFGNTPREDLARKGRFSLRGLLESCMRRESCHSWAFRLGVAGEARGEAGRGVPAQRMRLAHAPPLCARRRGAFAGSSHAALSCPRSRARCSCCCACSRVRRARCPLLREARTFRGALCEVSAFASRRWVCLSPFTRPLCLVRSFRSGARC